METEVLKDFAHMTEEELQLIEQELLRRAAHRFEQCGALHDAAECWTALGDHAQASVLYERTGNLELAARARLETQDYEQALTLYQRWDASFSQGNTLTRVPALLGQAACHFRATARRATHPQSFHQQQDGRLTNKLAGS